MTVSNSNRHCEALIQHGKRMINDRGFTEIPQSERPPDRE
jgi:hypothetical protein